jgi:hypothetical protein
VPPYSFSSNSKRMTLRLLETEGKGNGYLENLVSIYQYHPINILKELYLEACFLRSMDNIKMNCRQVYFEDLQWTKMTQCRFQEFCDTGYGTVALMKRRLCKNSSKSCTVDVIVLSLCCNHPVCWSRPEKKSYYPDQQMYNIQGIS